MQGIQVMSFSRSTIGKKVIMAVTGLAGIGFVIFHMYGNLKVFAGPAYFNEYSAGLRELGAPVFGHTHLLWLARIVLILSVVLHIWAATSLTIQARKARPDDYAARRTLQANYASKTMRLGGVVIFLFLIFHLMHLTFGVKAVNPQFEHGQVYSNLVYGFQSTPVAIFYIIAVLALGLHLYHGGWSLVQTLGILDPKYDTLVKRLSMLLAVLITVGFAIVPLAVISGIVTL